jgi:DNA-binding response OmpR family regulator
MRLLVVDDDTSVRMQVSMALDDVEVVEGFRAADVTAEAFAEPVDAVVVDRRLPDGDGLESVRSLRRNAATADLPVVVITADDHLSQRHAAFEAGADEHLYKPFEPGRLLVLVQGLVAMPASDRRVRRILHRARLHVGRDDGGFVDLLPMPEPEPATARRRRRRWRARTG